MAIPLVLLNRLFIWPWSVLSVIVLCLTSSMSLISMDKPSLFAAYSPPYFFTPLKNWMVSDRVLSPPLPYSDLPEVGDHAVFSVSSSTAHKTKSSTHMPGDYLFTTGMKWIPAKIWALWGHAKMSSFNKHCSRFFICQTVPSTVAYIREENRYRPWPPDPSFLRNT